MLQETIFRICFYRIRNTLRLKFTGSITGRYLISGTGVPDVTKPYQGDFPLKNLPFMELAPEFQGNIDPTVTLTLPRSGLSVVVGMLNGHKEELITNQAAQSGLDLNQADYQSLRSIDGGPSSVLKRLYG